MTTTYNSRQVIVSWGPYTLTDGALSEGTFAEVAPTARRATQTGLMGGDGVIAVLNSTLGTVTTTPSASAAINDDLTGELQAGIDSESPTVYKLMVKDHSGRSVASCPKAVLDGFPTLTYSEAVPTYQ